MPKRTRKEIVVRILFTFAGGSGHMEPLIPLARAAEAIGHVVAFAGQPRTLNPVAGADLPPWATYPQTAPLVYFTLGTVFNMESGDLFQRVLAGLRDLPINLIVTVGRDLDPAEFGSQPANVHIERYIAQAALLPHCHLVVSHGGSGSVMGALAHGLPMVLIPLGADQPLNGARCAALGVARVLDAVGATPQVVREAVVRVLEEPTYRQAAERLQAEIAALPTPNQVIRLLEQLVTRQALTLQ